MSDQCNKWIYIQEKINEPNLLIIPVSRGEFVGIENREDLDTTQLTLRLTKLIRATNQADSRDNPDLEDNEYYR